MHITELKESHAKDIFYKDKEILALHDTIKDLQINVDEIAALRTQVLLSYLVTFISHTNLYFSLNYTKLILKWREIKGRYY